MPVVDDVPAVAAAFVQHDVAVLVPGNLAAPRHHERGVLGRHLKSKDIELEQDEQEPEHCADDSRRLDVLVGVGKTAAGA